MPGPRRRTPGVPQDLAQLGPSRSGPSTPPPTGRPRRRPAPPPAGSPAPPAPQRHRPGSSTSASASDGTSTPTSSSSPTPLRSRPSTLARGIVKIFPVPAVLRCIRRGCSTSYGGASWTSRVQSLRRHLEREHGERVREHLYLFSVCSESLPTRPSCDPCLASTTTPADTAAPRHRCVRCPRAFPSARGLTNHERWHDVQDATAAASRRLPPSTPATRPPPTSEQPPSLSGGPTTPDSSPDRHRVSDSMGTPPPVGDASPSRATPPIPAKDPPLKHKPIGFRPGGAWHAQSDLTSFIRRRRES
ncbi:hypothetical protein HPB52_022948 [Rhipicephalus sanguineus]|uniref:C2H2-type domain-containing protein n=1 Tax=Rhipicephalus sanguineus TaxID=34632 RepID=A0A9D4PQG1_RHISA|nr:hypothetical protein HPB52_022948 [Rhipicephalus sanguineus]